MNPMVLYQKPCECIIYKFTDIHVLMLFSILCMLGYITVHIFRNQREHDIELVKWVRNLYEINGKR
jgi:hypothetical protein